MYARTHHNRKIAPYEIISYDNKCVLSVRQCVDFRREIISLTKLAHSNNHNNEIINIYDSERVPTINFVLKSALARGDFIKTTLFYSCALCLHIHVMYFHTYLSYYQQKLKTVIRRKRKSYNNLSVRCLFK